MSMQEYICQDTRFTKNSFHALNTRNWRKLSKGLHFNLPLHNIFCQPLQQRIVDIGSLPFSHWANLCIHFYLSSYSKDHVYRMVIVEGHCTMARSSSIRSKLFIGWHKSIVSSDWSDTMVWFGQILLYFNFYHPIHMILVLQLFLSEQSYIYDPTFVDTDVCWVNIELAKAEFDKSE